jgi:hypothetical protein
MDYLGLSGVDISMDNGNHWNAISNQSFHVCRKAKKGNAVYFCRGRRYSRETTVSKLCILAAQKKSLLKNRDFFFRLLPY